MALYWLIPPFLLWICIPFFAKSTATDALYRVRRSLRKLESDRTSIRRSVVVYLESVLQGSILRRLDAILITAGRPGNLRAVEVLLMQILMVVGVVALGSWAKKTPTSTLVIFGVLFCSLPWQNWVKKIKRRRLEAAEQMRFLKPRFATYLRRGLPFDQGLREIAETASGEFGEAFRARLQESRKRLLIDSLLDLQREFRCRELVSFVQAIKVAELKTSHALLKQIEKQIKEETARMDEFIDQQKSATDIKVRGYAAMAFAYVMIFVGYFAFYLIRNFLHQGHFFGL